MTVYTLQTGAAPLLISIPHLGTTIPEDLLAGMQRATALRLDDTDWHLDRLYAFARRMGASILTPSHSRYVIDLNRPPDDRNLYPGKNTTGLLPLDTFDEAPLYLAGREPDDAEKQRRRDLYWRPYHDALQGELQRLRGRHERVLLWEAHSIRSVVPRLFEGRLPDFNFGTADEASALPGLAQALADEAARAGYSAVANGRFKGGYITRHYGRPDQGIHAVQLELAQINYMDEAPPYAYDPARADRLAPVLERCLELALNTLSKDSR
ncbi:TPA: N-formylglutamate deformylase [Escherichia coli]|nr:N-formylglutamate deformylase [Escherichia coli]